jgi:hypothetical protein
MCGKSLTFRFFVLGLGAAPSKGANLAGHYEDAEHRVPTIERVVGQGRRLPVPAMPRIGRRSVEGAAQRPTASARKQGETE